MKKKKIIFYGELYPKTIHGVSISNSINLNCLAESFYIDIVEEKFSFRSHNLVSIGKIILFLKYLIVFFSKNLLNRYNYFYSPIYLSSFGIFKNLACCFVFKMLNFNSRIILHLHRGDFNEFKSKKINSILFNILDFFVYKFIVLSKSQKLELKHFGFLNTFVLYNTVQKELYFDDNYYKKDNSKISVTYISNYIKEKGIEELIYAINELHKDFKNIELKCYGNFTDRDFEVRLKRLVQNKNFIKLNNSIIGKDKISTMINSDVIILPSYNEGVPILMLESLKFGIPLIISNVGYIDEFLGQDYKLYCSPKNYKSIVRAFYKFIEIDKKKFSKDLKKIFSKFSLEIHQNEINNIFK